MTQSRPHPVTHPTTHPVTRPVTRSLTRVVTRVTRVATAERRGAELPGPVAPRHADRGGDPETTRREGTAPPRS